MSDQPVQQNSYVNSYQPPAASAAGSVDGPNSVPSSKPEASQALEDQNIFDLLGVTDADENERESFLDELQQVIWEDFLENDVQLLVTEEEMSQLKQILNKQGQDELEKQEEIIAFLEKLIPNLEEILLEKALELKADMVKERMVGMRQLYADQAEKLKVLDQAEHYMAEDQWQQVRESLNSIE